MKQKHIIFEFLNFWKQINDMFLEFLIL